MYGSNFFTISKSIFKYNLAERFVMVAGVIDVTTAAIDEAVRTTVACEIINIGFVPSPLGQ